jgi:hypothetical protein
MCQRIALVGQPFLSQFRLDLITNLIVKAVVSRDVGYADCSSHLHVPAKLTPFLMVCLVSD